MGLASVCLCWAALFFAGWSFPASSDTAPEVWNGADLRPAPLSGGSPDRARPAEVAAFAKRVEREAAARGARVFLLARVGRARESLPPGIEFTHAGIAVHSRIRRADGKLGTGYVVYNLYQQRDRPNRSVLFNDFVVDFFADVAELEAGIAIPTMDLQLKLARFLATGAHKTLHNRVYSAVSNPFNREFQNCNEYLLDIINAAVYDELDASKLKAIAKAHFDPQVVKAGPMRLLFAGLFSPDIALRDHGQSTVATATYGSLVAYLEKYDLLTSSFLLQP